MDYAAVLLFGKEIKNKVDVGQILFYLFHNAVGINLMIVSSMLDIGKDSDFTFTREYPRHGYIIASRQCNILTPGRILSRG